VTVAVISVTVVNSGQPSDDRTIILRLRNAVGGARIDANHSTVSVIIMAHDHVAGLLGFNQTSVNVTEGRNIFMSAKCMERMAEMTFSSYVCLCVCASNNDVTSLCTVCDVISSNACSQNRACYIVIEINIRKE